MHIIRLLPMLVLALCSTVSHADTLIQKFNFFASVGAGSNGSDQVDPYFDPALGNLTAVSLEVQGTNHLTSDFKATCGLDSNGNCFIRGDFSITLFGSLFDPSINSLLRTDTFWIFDPVTDEPVLIHGMGQGTNYPDTAWAQFYTSGDSSPINWYTWFKDENAGNPGSASDSGEVNFTLTFTYTYDPIDADGDGVPDIWDAYPNISLGGRLDTDDDGIPNDCDAACIILGMLADLDDDGDEEIDTSDNCPLTVNPLQADIDLDQVGDLCDNCISIANPGQESSAVNPNCGQACETAGCFGLVCENH